ncbi:MAG: DUF3488 and transglutaminase-like domain-containing protein [Protaetiibacter sp.]
MALTETRAPERPVAARGARDGRSGTPHWVRALLVAVALATALAGLHVVLQGLSWWLVGTGCAVAVLLAAAVTRSVLRSAFWPPIVSLAVGGALLTLGYAADTTVLGVVPTPGTIARLGELVESGVAEIAEQHAPATPEPGIVLLIAVFMTAAAWVADLAVSTRHPALTAVPFAAILAVPMAVGPELTDAFWYLATAALYLVILRIGRQRDSRPAVLVTGAVVVLGSLLAPLALPAVGERPAPRTPGLHFGVNPLVSLGDELRRGDAVLALSYTSDAERPVYLRLTTLENFTGSTWGPTIGSKRTDGLDRFPAPAGYSADVAAHEATVEVKVAGLLTAWLPVPYPTTSVTGVTGSWFYQPDTLTVRSIGESARGQEYQASFLEVRPTTAQLAAAGAAPGDAPPGTLELPDEVPAIIRDTAMEATSGAATPYEKAIALQSYLRGSPFQYSEDAPVEDDFDGTGIDAIAAFLAVKSGYCIHYASAMAVMARLLDIPSRLAVGFQPGHQAADRSPVLQVSTDDLHAWPELYFEGIGWLRFEPTPGRGVVPDYEPALVDDPSTPQDESSPTPTSTATATPVARPDRDETPQTPAEAAAQQSASLLGWLGVLAGLVVLALVPAAFRMAVRRSRIRRMRRGPDPAAAAWEEVRDTARDVGWSAPETETPRALASRLASTSPGDGQALGAFRGRVEESAYGRPDAVVLSVSELAAVRRATLRSADPGPRLRAVLLPPSLLRRWRPGAR